MAELSQPAGPRKLWTAARALDPLPERTPRSHCLLRARCWGAEIRARGHWVQEGNGGVRRGRRAVLQRRRVAATGLAAARPQPRTAARLRRGCGRPCGRASVPVKALKAVSGHLTCGGSVCTPVGPAAVAGTANLCRVPLQPLPGARAAVCPGHALRSASLCGRPPFPALPSMHALGLPPAPAPRGCSRGHRSGHTTDVNKTPVPEFTPAQGSARIPRTRSRRVFGSSHVLCGSHPRRLGVIPGTPENLPRGPRQTCSRPAPAGPSSARAGQSWPHGPHTGRPRGRWRRGEGSTPSAQCEPRPPLCGLAQLRARHSAQPISPLPPTAAADWPRQGSQSELVPGSQVLEVESRWTEAATSSPRWLPALVPHSQLPGASRAAYVICTTRLGVTPWGPPAPHQPPAALLMVARPRVSPLGLRVVGRPPQTAPPH